MLVIGKLSRFRTGFTVIVSRFVVAMIEKPIKPTPRRAIADKSTRDLNSYFFSHFHFQSALSSDRIPCD